jgi:hypothetical protein
MKTLLVVGGILLLVLGLLLLIAALVMFLVSRGRRARQAAPAGLPPQPHQQPPAPQPVARPAAAPPPPRPVTVPAAPVVPPPMTPPPMAPAPVAAAAASPGVEATVVAARPGAGTLHGVSGKVAGQSFPIPLDGFYIGRDRTLSQVVIEDPSVSKKHVWVGLREGVLMAIDQSSTNGTYVNSIGTRIGQVRLAPGDTLIISDDVARLVYKS